ncbi:MAG: endonuclease/exonuclease/phosphatase family protein, partial [Cereibacter sp.]
MGLSYRQSFHARHCDRPQRGQDPQDTPPHRHRWLYGLLSLFLACLWAGPCLAETLRVATFHAELSRDGPGLLLRDILRSDPQVEAAARVIAFADPDVLVLLGIDYDHGLVALGAFADRVAAAGSVYPHRFALRPNTGYATGLDMDGDGRLGGPRDAQGYGRFAGQGGMAVLSRLSIDPAGVRDLSGLLWR